MSSTTASWPSTCAPFGRGEPIPGRRGKRCAPFFPLRPRPPTPPPAGARATRPQNPGNPLFPIPPPLRQGGEPPRCQWPEARRVGQKGCVPFRALAPHQPPGFPTIGKRFPMVGKVFVSRHVRQVFSKRGLFCRSAGGPPAKPKKPHFPPSSRSHRAWRRVPSPPVHGSSSLCKGSGVWSPRVYVPKTPYDSFV